MKLLLTLLACGLGAAGLWYLLDGPGPSSTPAIEDEGSAAQLPSGAGEGGDGMLGAERAQISDVDLEGVGRLPAVDPQNPDGWRQEPFRWPGGATKVTGKDLLVAAGGHIGIRFASAEDRERFERATILPHVPAQPVLLEMILHLPNLAGFIAEHKLTESSAYLLIRSPRADEEAPPGLSPADFP